MLTVENYAQGFLIDDEWMAGVSATAAAHAASPAADGEPAYAAFIIDHATGDYVGYRVFGDLQSAIDSVNAIPRAWKFETTSGCGSCGASVADGGHPTNGEGCGKGACRQTCQTTGACELQD